MEKYNEYRDIWEMLDSVMRETYVNTKQSYELWFGRLRIKHLDAERAVFVCESEIKKNILLSRHMDFLAESLDNVLGYSPEISIDVDTSLAPVVFDDGTVDSPLRIVKERRAAREAAEKAAREAAEAASSGKSESDGLQSEFQASDTSQSASHFETVGDDMRSAAAALSGKLGKLGGISSGISGGAESPLTPERLGELEGKYESPFKSAGENKSGRVYYNEDYTFENFIIGSSNRFAHAAALSVADNTTGRRINPLFIWGPPGLGKTHLMYAIANRALERDPNLNVIYVKGEEFMNQLIDALNKRGDEGGPAEFRAKYRSADMLLIDDIQYIAGKAATERELFHTFDTLYEDKKQIIITSDRPPKELTEIAERLRSRFEAGLLADIQPPDYELRVAVLRGKIEQNKIEVPSDVVDFLAQNLQENIRQLEGVIKKLAMSNLLSGQPVNMEMVIQTVPEYLREVEPVHDLVDRIIACVSRHYSVSVDDILHGGRTKKVIEARNAAIYVTRFMTNQSLNQLGAIFGKNHATIHNSLTNVESDLLTDPVLDATINEIIKEVKRGG